MKTMKNLDYLLPVIIGDNLGFSDPAFIPNVGELAPKRAESKRVRCGHAGDIELHRQRAAQKEAQAQSRRHFGPLDPSLWSIYAITSE
jgi:hypothetical protein